MSGDFVVRTSAARMETANDNDQSACVPRAHGVSRPCLKPPSYASSPWALRAEHVAFSCGHFGTVEPRYSVTGDASTNPPAAEEISDKKTLVNSPLSKHFEVLPEIYVCPQL